MHFVVLKKKKQKQPYSGILANGNPNSQEWDVRLKSIISQLLLSLDYQTWYQIKVYSRIRKGNTTL